MKATIHLTANVEVPSRDMKLSNPDFIFEDDTVVVRLGVLHEGIKLITIFDDDFKAHLEFPDEKTDGWQLAEELTRIATDCLSWCTEQDKYFIYKEKLDGVKARLEEMKDEN